MRVCQFRHTCKALIYYMGTFSKKQVLFRENINFFSGEIYSITRTFTMPSIAFSAAIRLSLGLLFTSNTV